MKIATGQVHKSRVKSPACGLKCRQPWVWKITQKDSVLNKYTVLSLYVAKYHLGKVKLERVGQRSSPTSVCDI